METARDSLAALSSVIRVAVHSDDPARLIAEASLAARRPLALVGRHGEPLGHAPSGAGGRRAAAVAHAAAHNRLVGAAGWSIVAIKRGPSSLGFLAIGADRKGGDRTRRLLDVLPELFAEQLHRVALLHAQRGAFVRRLISDPRFGACDAYAEAADVNLGLADAYWPALLTWQRAVPPVAVLERVTRDALRAAQGSLGAALDRRVVLLYPGRAATEPFGWLERIVDQARTLAPSFPVQAIAGERAVELARVSAAVAELEALRRLGPRVEGRRPVVSLREYALERLFWESVDATAARRFVDEQLGSLIAWDREHRTDLLSVLEAALDFPRHDQAASRCFMHRNTFRHRLHQAGEVLGADVSEDPDRRLAVHVALKLRRLLAAASLHADDAAPAEEPASDSRRTKRRLAGSASERARRPLSRSV